MSEQTDNLRPETGHDVSVFPETLRGKRILLCTESFGPVNGVSRTTLMLVNHLRAHGANVAVVAPHNHTKVNTFVPASVPAPSSPSPADTTSAASPVNPEVRIRGYPLPYNPELSIVYPVRLSALYARTFGTAPDLIYVASPASLGFQVLLQVRQQPASARVPVLCNFQTDLAGYCAILFPAPLGGLAVYTFSRVQGFLFSHPSVRRIFYPSRFVRRYLESNGVPTAKMTLLQRGVDTELFHPRRRCAELRRRIAPGGRVVLLCVARLAGEKGFDFLAAAAQELDARGLAFTLHIVGGNRNAEVEAEVQGQFADLQRRGKVVFAGFQVGEALATAYASADVFLHCSVTETFGLVVLESMASGVPVVARDEGGPSDIIRDGVSGYLVPPDDLRGFVDKVVRLVEDQGQRERFSLEARRQAESATWEKINNTVAWGMADAIQEREKQLHGSLRRVEKGHSLSSVDKASSPLWQLLKAVDAGLFSGLGVITGFWGLVGAYLMFIEAALWIRARFRWWW